MSLKEEIAKLVQSERAALEKRDREHSDYHARQRERFAAMRRVLEELSESIDKQYLRAHFGPHWGFFEVGRQEDGYFSVAVQWKIEPNFRVRCATDTAESLFIEEPGFRVEETRHYRYPDPDVSENRMVFDDESAVASHMVISVAKEVAKYSHLDAKAAKRTDGNA